MAMFRTAEECFALGKQGSVATTPCKTYIVTGGDNGHVSTEVVDFQAKPAEMENRPGIDGVPVIHWRFC